MLQWSKKEPELEEVVSSRHDPVLIHQADGPVTALAYNWRAARLAFCVGGWVHELSGNRNERVFRQGFSASTLVRYDCEGRLLGSAGTEQPLVRMLEDGSNWESLVSAYKGEPLEDIRGIVGHSSGMLHCSDARAGGRPSRIYLINGESQDVVSVSEAIRSPGSLCYSPDERYLYVAEPKSSRIMRLRILPSGELQYRCLFAEVSGGAHPDGEMAVDSRGHLFWGSGEGVHLFDRGGKHLGTVAIDRSCAALCFAGRDLKTLLFAEQSRIWSLRVDYPGARPVI